MSSHPHEGHARAPTSTRRSSSTQHARLLTLFIIAVACGSLLYPPLPVLTLMADTDQYRAMSRSLLDGSFLNPVDVTQVGHLATVMRPPLFPLLLASASLVPGLNAPESLIALHLCIALALLVAFPLLLRPIVPPPVTALACGIALFSAKQVVWGEMSEWLAMSCLCAATVSYVLWRHTSRATQAFAASLFVSLAILTRSALMPWLIFPLILLAQAHRADRRRTALAVLIGTMPLAVWSGIQVHRLGSFSLGAYEGLNVIATARSLGEIPVGPTDSPANQLVLARLNERGITVSEGGLDPAHVHQWDGEFYVAFHHNFDEVCAAVQAIAPGEPLPTLRVAARAFMAHGERYISFLYGGLETFTRECAPLLLTCLGVGLWLRYRSPSDQALAKASIAVSLVSAVCAASIFISILWLHRYFLPIQGPLMFLSLLSLFALVSSVHFDRHR